ncbi:MAG: CCA tRNA nucleotidyltransferase [Clostridia bacterium]|nr:CCA tRNA nucleotidyltransferase [Clostridia bacterium]
MKSIIPQNLIRLANELPTPLYVVGGAVRDFLAGLQTKTAKDWDICAPLPPDEFIPVAKCCGFTVCASYKHTGTVKLKDELGTEYEYCCFRSDEYVRGTHRPVQVYFTTDIRLDATRRDFTCNAVYYDVQKDTYQDPLDGISAIREKRLSTVAPANKVFGEDGLRLMRLARQTATLGFTPDAECIRGAQANAHLIQDISPERIFTELRAILLADEKYGIPYGHYRGLKTLELIGVLDIIMPELTLGKGMKQRADFHNYDVLEHSLRATLYADTSVRFATLLHDVGKPFCEIRDGSSHDHPVEGARIAREILTRLQAPKRLVEETATLVELHMYDLDGKTGENKLRRFLVKHYAVLEKLLLVKQADYSGCKDDTGVAPTCKRWRALLTKMQGERVPFTVKGLSVTGNDLLTAGLPAPILSRILEQLLLHVAVRPQDNDSVTLIKLAYAFSK